MEHDQNCLFCSLFRRYAMSCHIIGFGGMIVLHMTSSWCLLLFLFQNASPAFCVHHAAIQGGSYHWDSFLKIPSPTRSIPHGKCHPLMDKIPSSVDINKGSEISHDQFHLETRIQIPSSPQISHKKNARWFKKANPNFRTSLIARWGQKSTQQPTPQKFTGHLSLLSVHRDQLLKLLSNLQDLVPAGVFMLSQISFSFGAIIAKYLPQSKKILQHPVTSKLPWIPLSSKKLPSP